MRTRMSTTTPEKDPHMVMIQKIIPHIGDCLRTMECAFKTGQDAQLKATKKLAQEVKQLRATVGDFTSGRFQLTFTPGRNRLLPQSFNHTLHRREQSCSPTSHTTRHPFPHFTSPLPSFLPPFVFPPKPLDSSAPCAPSVLEAFDKNTEVPKYKLSRKISTIPEIWREWIVGTMGCLFIKKLDQQYGSRLRPEHKERQFYSVRRVIIEEFRRRAIKKRGYDDNIAKVVKEMEVERTSLGVSLAKISVVLRKQANEREQSSG